MLSAKRPRSYEARVYNEELHTLLCMCCFSYYNPPVLLSNNVHSTGKPVSNALFHSV